METRQFQGISTEIKATSVSLGLVADSNVLMAKLTETASKNKQYNDLKVILLTHLSFDVSVVLNEPKINWSFGH